MSYKPIAVQTEMNMAWAENKIKKAMSSAMEMLEWCDITVKIEAGNVVHFEKVSKEKPPKRN